jgi:hypothetical protein
LQRLERAHLATQHQPRLAAARLCNPTVLPSHHCLVAGVRDLEIQAQYFRSPFNYTVTLQRRGRTAPCPAAPRLPPCGRCRQEYLDRNIFLPDINNERPIKNATYKANLVSLNKFVMIRSAALQNSSVPSPSPPTERLHTARQPRPVDRAALPLTPKSFRGIANGSPLLRTAACRMYAFGHEGLPD